MNEPILIAVWVILACAVVYAVYCGIDWWLDDLHAKMRDADL